MPYKTGVALGFDLGGDDGQLLVLFGIGVNLSFKLKKSISSGFVLISMIGARQVGTYCPRSYLGFRCYADADPEGIYELDYGGIVGYQFKRRSVGAGFLIGTKVTSGTVQGVVGYRW
ncbi:MAG: hypothetical protein OXC64_00845 [Flavobacteriaceae bacterium]|nr:hypothetical protein [Flavobacteriaceae bacterium]